jgi:hypothetical protein
VSDGITDVTEPNERRFLLKVLAAIFLIQYVLFLLIFLGCFIGPFLGGTLSQGNPCPNYANRAQEVFAVTTQTILALLAGKELGR